MEALRVLRALRVQFPFVLENLGALGALAVQLLFLGSCCYQDLGASVLE